MAGSVKSNDLFDPGFENQTPEFTRASQGFKGDGSTGTLLSGLGDFIKDKFTLEDNYFKQKSREELTVETDKIKNIWSGIDQRQGGWTLKAVGVEDPDHVAQEITKRGERLGRLDAAHRSGRITGTHYWTMLDVAAREMRSKYPGYREHIDNVMKDLTGADPANKIIEGIRQEANRDKDSDPDKALKSMVKQAAQDGYLGYTGYKAGADFMPVKADGTPANPADFINAVSKTRAIHYKNQHDKDKLALDEAEGKATDRDVMRNAQDRVDTVMAGAFTAATSVALGGTPAEVTAKIDKLAADARNGKPLKGEDLTRIEAEWAVSRNGIMRQVQKELAETPGLKRMTPEQRKQVMESAELRLAQYDDIIINKNWGLARHNQAVAANITDSTVASLIDNNDTMRNTAALNKVGGQEFVKNYYSANPKSFSDLQVQLKNDSITKMLATGVPIKAEVDRAAKQANIKNSEYYDVLIDQTVKTVLDPKIPKPILDNAIKALYGPKNASLLWTHNGTDYVSTYPANKGQEYYAKLVNPEMTKRVLDLANTTGDSSIWTNYYGWATRSFTNNREVHKALTDVKRLSMDTDQPFGLKYNPTDGTLSVEQRATGPNRRYDASVLTAFRAQANQAADTYNRAVEPMRSIFVESKQPIDNILNGMFTLNGMNPSDLSYRKPQ
jgi:hypothetical protein